jgi:hypothetical protein
MIGSKEKPPPYASACDSSRHWRSEQSNRLSSAQWPKLLPISLNRECKVRTEMRT